MSNVTNDQCNDNLDQNTVTVQWIGFQTIVIKEIWRFLRIWVQTLLPPVITMTLYFIIFGNLIGQRIGEMGGLDYMQFIAPGLIMMSIINNSFGNVVSSFYSARFQNCIEEILVSPLHNSLMVMGFVTGGVIRGLVVGIIVTGIAMLFTDLHIHDLSVTITVAVLSAILFSLLGFLNALFARSFDDISIVPTFFLAPLTYLGGVFYSISLLPEFWQAVSKINPILYMVNTFRFGMLGVSDIPVTYALIVLVGVITLIFAIILTLINRGIGIRK
jgi:ABC-2 type transport system permease protein